MPAPMTCNLAAALAGRGHTVMQIGCGFETYERVAFRAFKALASRFACASKNMAARHETAPSHVNALGLTVQDFAATLPHEATSSTLYTDQAKELAGGAALSRTKGYHGALHPKIAGRLACLHANIT